MNNKYVDLTSIIQVIGSVYNEPEILDATDKYNIIEDDFPSQFHKIVFGVIYKIYELGAKEITVESILDFLSTRPKSEAIFKQENGVEWIKRASENAIPNAFEYYYGRLKKMTLLRTYDAFGVDVSYLYDPDNVLDTKKKQEQEDWLDNSSLEMIAARIDDKIESIKAKYIDGVQSMGAQAADGIDEMLEELEKAPDVGIPMYGALINTVTRGARLRKMYLRSAATGTGKAIPNNTLIPTPSGYMKVGEIQVGDCLFGQDGKPAKVLAIHPQPEKKEIWKVHFSDGRVAECCGEHLWEYRYQSHRGFKYRVEDTQTIYNRTLSLKNGFKDSEGKGYRFSVKLNEPVDYKKKDYTLDPYILGAFLGDGSFRYDNTNKSLAFSSENEDIPNMICKILGPSFYAEKCSQLNYSWVFKTTNNSHHPIWVEEFLKEYPELWNIKSEDKFIPSKYLLGSIEQRYALLQGLLDTDGTIDIKGRVRFTTISKKLRDNVIELCHSLGLIAAYSVDDRLGKYSTGKCYSISIQCKKSLKPLLFRLKRKKDIATEYSLSTKREEYKDHNAIVSIEKTEEKVDMTCFTVDNEDHLFLMNDYIVTHNTRSMIADTCYFGCNKIYDENFGWISTGAAQPTLYITTEQEKSEIQTMMLAFLSNVNEEKIINGTMEGEERERVKVAVEVLKTSKIFIEELPDFSLQDVENVIKKNIRENGIIYVLMDYIMTSLKILSEISKKSGGVKIREDNVLFMLSRRLKDIANKYGVFVMSATQLNMNYQESDTPDQNLLRGSKAIADSVDYGSILLSVTQKDLEALEPILSTNTFERPNLKISVYKNRRGRWKSVYLWCKADLGVCRINPMFCTDWNYEILSINDLRIITEEESAF